MCVQICSTFETKSICIDAAKRECEKLCVQVCSTFETKSIGKDAAKKDQKRCVTRPNAHSRGKACEKMLRKEIVTGMCVQVQGRIDMVGKHTEFCCEKRLTRGMCAISRYTRATVCEEMQRREIV